MRPFYFLFLSVVVAMGQTTVLTGPTTLAPHSLVENSATDMFYIPRCSDLITYGKTTKAVRDMFPEECLNSLPDCRFGVAKGETCVLAPKLESTEPPQSSPVYGDQPGSLSLDKPLGLGHGFDWQAIADHCHIDVYESPIPTNPQPDTWEAVTGMRIVCK
jgi:hypothetical protein